MGGTRSSSDVVFLLGAGASVDAGMPDVATLSQELWARLPHMRDVNGLPCPAISEVFNTIVRVDKEVEVNYERFFEWIRLFLDVTKDPFAKLIRTDLTQSLTEGMVHFAWGG